MCKSPEAEMSFPFEAKKRSNVAGYGRGSVTRGIFTRMIFEFFLREGYCHEVRCNYSFIMYLVATILC